GRRAGGGATRARAGGRRRPGPRRATPSPRRRSTLGSMRLRPLWIWRAAFLGFAVVYLASSSLQEWLPPLLPFLAAAAVEAHFFIAGSRARRGYRAPENPGPQQRDLEELGWPEDVDPDAEAPPPPPQQQRTPWLRRLVPALVVLAILAGAVFLDSATAHW